MVSTYHTNHWSSNSPTKFPPHKRIISYHISDSIIEPINTECPAYGDALEEDQKQKTETGNSIRIEDLEDVHATLRDTG